MLLYGTDVVSNVLMIIELVDMMIALLREEGSEFKVGMPPPLKEALLVHVQLQTWQSDHITVWLI